MSETKLSSVKKKRPAPFFTYLKMFDRGGSKFTPLPTEIGLSCGRLLKISFLYGVNKSVHQSIMDGLMNNFGILHPYKWFKSPLRDYKKCLPNITFQSKYHLRNRATQGRLYFSPIGTGNMQMGCLYADFTRLCGSVTPLPPSDHGPDNDIIYDVGRIF